MNKETKEACDWFVVGLILIGGVLFYGNVVIAAVWATRKIWGLG